MEEPPPNKNSFLCVLFFAICVVFVSCSEDKANIVFTQSNIVFDFENGAPSQRLSVFAQVSSNVRRLDSISVTCGDYVWKIENPLLFQASNQSFAGYMHLEPPPNLKKLPKGKYSVECFDAAGNSATGNFFVDYDDALFENDYSEEFFLGEGWAERIAVYSAGFELLYFEARNEEWNDDAQIFSSVKDSNSLRHIFEKGATVCLAPKIYKDGGSGNEL